MSDIWLKNNDELSDLLADPAALLGVDTEFVRERTFWPKLALVQFAVGGRSVLVDPLAFPGMEQLGRNLTEPDRIVVMHSAGEDLTALRPLQPAPMTGLYDTQIAAAFAGLGPGLGYQSLVASLLDVKLDKQETRSDWLARPLSQRQLDYALDDVRHLAALHAILDERLGQRGFRDWHRQDCQRLAVDAWSAASDPQPQRSFRNLWRWPVPAQTQLRRILLWREQAARERDLPRRWVIDDDTAAAVAAEPAHSAARLAARLENGPPGRRKSLLPLVNLLSREPDEQEIAGTEPIAAPHDPALKPVMKRLKSEVEQVASELDVPAGLLCPRRAIESLVATGQWPAELAGWRGELLRARLTALL